MRFVGTKFDEAKNVGYPESWLSQTEDWGRFWITMISDNHDFWPENRVFRPENPVFRPENPWFSGRKSWLSEIMVIQDGAQSSV